MTGFHDVVFPPPIGDRTKWSPRWKNTVLRLKSGAERRNLEWSQSLYEGEAVGAIRTFDQMQELIRFFHARRAQTYSFRFKDYSDFSSAANGRDTPTPTDQLLGTGTGALTVFQIVKNYDDLGNTYARTLTKIIANTLRVSINAVEKLAGDGTFPWSVDLVTGLLTFTGTPPPNTQLVKAGFNFHNHARFDTEVLSTQFIEYRNLTASVPLLEVREC